MVEFLKHSCIFKLHSSSHFYDINYEIKYQKPEKVVNPSAPQLQTIIYLDSNDLPQIVIWRVFKNE